MSDENRRSSAPQNSPWSPDLLADLHAGALDPDTAARTRDAAADDPHAREVLAALDNTTHELGQLAAESAPAVIPDSIAERLDNALAEQLGTTNATPIPTGGTAATAAITPPDTDVPSAGTHPPAATVHHHEATPPQGTVVNFTARRRKTFLVAGVVAAAASIAAIVFAFQPLGTRTTEQAQTEPPAPTRAAPVAPDEPVPQHQPADNSEPIALQGDEADLNGPQLAQVMGQQQYLGLDDPAHLPGCLQANGVTQDTPLGAHNITLNGQPAQLFVLSTGNLGQFRLLAVGPQCGTDNPATMSDSTFGGT